MNAICTACKKACQALIVNNGIGSYEYWGAKGVDNNLTVESSCCGEPCQHENGSIITVEEVIEYFYNNINP